MGLEELLQGLKKADNLFTIEHSIKEIHDEIITNILKKINYESKDVQELINTEQVKKYNENKDNHLGLYISASINNKINEDETLKLKINYKIDFLGTCHSRGRIEIEGDVGNFLGNQMRGGEIIVKGSAGEKAGLRMNKGRIMIHGNAGKGLGILMKGGGIIIEGRTKDVGYYMSGGIIKAGKIDKINEHYHSGVIISKDRTRLRGLIKESAIKGLIKNNIKIEDYLVTDELIYPLLKFPIVLEHKNELFTKETLDKYEHVFIEAALEAA